MNGADMGLSMLIDKRFQRKTRPYNGVWCSHNLCGEGRVYKERGMTLIAVTCPRVVTRSSHATVTALTCLPSQVL